MPTLSITGGKSPDWMRGALPQVADVLPDGEYRTIDGQNHVRKPDAIAPVLTDFFRSDRGTGHGTGVNLGRG